MRKAYAQQLRDGAFGVIAEGQRPVDHTLILSKIRLPVASTSGSNTRRQTVV